MKHIGISIKRWKREITNKEIALHIQWEIETLQAEIEELKQTQEVANEYIVRYHMSIYYELKEKNRRLKMKIIQFEQDEKVDNL